MNKFGFLFCFTFITSFVFAQGPTVPDKIQFADMQLDLTPDARKKIQADVNALRRSERYFRMKLERVDLYMPLIERAFREEKVPEDIKYLVIQESALIGDAVSSANAIGYWQFKVPAAQEVGLSINGAVDERMNIVNASHGTARYFKNNNTYFDNWLYALLAYNTGPGGALKIADKSKYGVKRMKLDGRTHWYVLKFLAHKIAFEDDIGKNPNPETELIAYTQGGGKTLGEIAAAFDLTEADLDPYNKWLKKKHVPTDKTYYVILPLKTGEKREELLASAPAPNKNDNTSTATTQKTTEIKTESNRFPVIEKHTSRKGTTILINGIPGTIALEGENLNKLVTRTDLPAKKLRKYNDLDRKGADIEEGKPYYLKKKRNKAKTHYHVVASGETLWSISQRFGIKQKKLMRNNRMKKEEALKPGRILWMRFIRPRDYPIEYQDIPIEKEKPMLAVNQQPAAKQTEVTKEPEPIATEKQAVQNDPPFHNNPNAPASQPSIQDKSGPSDMGVNYESPANDDFEVDDNFTFNNTDQPKRSATFHTVQQGDTWYGIARQYGVNIPDLVRINNMQTDDKLKIGQQLRIPSTAQLASNNTLVEKEETIDTGKTVLHLVKIGETMYSISRHYGVTVKDLMDWNQKETFDLAVGEELRVLTIP